MNMGYKYPYTCPSQSYPIAWTMTLSGEDMVAHARATWKTCAKTFDKDASGIDKYYYSESHLVGWRILPVKILHVSTLKFWGSCRKASHTSLKVERNIMDKATTNYKK